MLVRKCLVIREDCSGIYDGGVVVVVVVTRKRQ